MTPLTLTALPDSYAICRLAPGQPIPAWAIAAEGFVSITRTADELSVVCSEASAPEGIAASRGWRCLRVEGPLDFALVGVLGSLAAPLAEAGVSIFAISTYDTDYLLVSEQDVAAAIQALKTAGHTMRT
jgi:hypothetical protein